MRGVVEKRLSDRASWATQAGSAVDDCAGCAILKREYDGMREKLNEVGRRSITTKATKKAANDDAPSVSHATTFDPRTMLALLSFSP